MLGVGRRGEPGIHKASRVCSRTPSQQYEHLHFLGPETSLTDPKSPLSHPPCLFSQVSEEVSALNPLQPDAGPHQNCWHLVISADSSAACGVHPWLLWLVSFLPSLVSRVPTPLDSPPTSWLHLLSQLSILKLFPWAPFLLSCFPVPRRLHPWLQLSRDTLRPPSLSSPIPPLPAAVSGLSEGHPHPLLGDRSPSPSKSCLPPSLAHMLPSMLASPHILQFSSFNSVQLVPSSVLLPLLWIKPLTLKLNHISQIVPKFQSSSHFQHPLLIALPGQFLKQASFITSLSCLEPPPHSEHDAPILSKAPYS